MSATEVRKVILPTASCEVVDDDPAPMSTTQPSKSETVQLCMFQKPRTAVETISRTLRYAQNPEKYLLETLGEAEFSARKHLFCLPSGTITLDQYGKGSTKEEFQSHIAKLLGKQHGLFFLTGVQAQLAALATYAERSGRKKVAWHESSHLESAESGAYEKLYGLERVLLGSSPHTLPTVEEIVLALEQEWYNLAAIVLEIPNRTLGCLTYSFESLLEISKICKKYDIALHCDGARLWEVEPWYAAGGEGTSLEELCGCFDSVYVSFYKGLGGLAGAILVHSDVVFMEDVKVWQRRAGGNAFTLGVEVLDCQRGFNEMYGTFGRKGEKMRRIVAGVKAATEAFKNDEGGAIVGFVPWEPVCSQILTVFRGFSQEELICARDRVQVKSGVRVFERLRPKQTLDEMMLADRIKIKSGSAQETIVPGAKEDQVHFMEWMIMDVTEKIEDGVFVKGYVDLCEELLKGRER